MAGLRLVSSAKHLLPSGRFCLGINAHAWLFTPQTGFKNGNCSGNVSWACLPSVFLIPQMSHSSVSQLLSMDFVWLPGFWFYVEACREHCVCLPSLYALVWSITRLITASRSVRHTSEILWVQFQTTEIKWVMRFFGFPMHVKLCLHHPVVCFLFFF